MFFLAVEGSVKGLGVVCGDGGIGFWSRRVCVCPVSGVRGWERALLTPRPVWPQVCQGILRARGIYDRPQLTPATQHLWKNPPSSTTLSVRAKQCIYSYTTSQWERVWFITPDSFISFWLLNVSKFDFRLWANMNSFIWYWCLKLDMVVMVYVNLSHTCGVQLLKCCFWSLSVFRCRTSGFLIPPPSQLHVMTLLCFSKMGGRRWDRQEETLMNDGPESKISTFSAYSAFTNSHGSNIMHTWLCFDFIFEIRN